MIRETDILIQLYKAEAHGEITYACTEDEERTLKLKQ